MHWYSFFVVNQGKLNGNWSLILGKFHLSLEWSTTYCILLICAHVLRPKCHLRIFKNSPVSQIYLRITGVQLDVYIVHNESARYSLHFFRQPVSLLLHAQVYLNFKVLDAVGGVLKEQEVGYSSVSMHRDPEHVQIDICTRRYASACCGRM